MNNPFIICGAAIALLAVVVPHVNPRSYAEACLTNDWDLENNTFRRITCRVAVRAVLELEGDAAFAGMIAGAVAKKAFE